MDKPKLHTADMAQRNIELLGQLFPGCLTETTNSDGKTVRAIDFDILRQEVACEVIEGGDERYQFSWPGKLSAIRLANSPTSATLRPCREESVDFDNTENLYIEGDNLDVLKLLRQSYANKIRVIYIDPPYNTGNSFIYNDKFSAHSKQWSKMRVLSHKANCNDTDPAMLNNEIESRLHSNWLNMIYPRIKVAKELLSDDGVIFISIADNEVENLKKVCNELLGESNFITQFIWEKTQHFGRQKLNCYSNCDYILCYGKSLYRNSHKELLVERVKTQLQDAPLFNALNNIATITLPAHSTLFNLKDGTYTHSASAKYELLDSVTVKGGRNVNAFRLRFRSRWSNKTLQEEYAKGTTFWVKTRSFAIRAIYGGNRFSTEAPRQIIFTNTGNPMATRDRWNNRIETGENATNALNKLMNGSFFSYPKPVSLIKYLLSLLYNHKCNEHDKDFYVLDFFSGSATTAHAVMQLNAQDGGNRRFIMVQLPEETHEKSDAGKAGYKNICEIGKERIRRAGKLASNDPQRPIDIGFRVLKLNEPNITHTRHTTDEALLFQVLPLCNLPLSSKIDVREITGKRVYTVNGRYLMACFDPAINEAVITAIAQEQPAYFIMRHNPTAPYNIEHIFKHYSPETNCITI